jgi:LL-diaminopimelate aminotransferase
MERLESYAFAELQGRVAELRSSGVEVVDFGVGDPTAPTPLVVREACKRAVDAHAASGYPRYAGSERFRRAAADWIDRRFRVRLDAEAEVTSTIGSKEAIFHFHQAIVAPGDVVLCPSPGYPPYVRGTVVAGGVPYQVPVCESSDWLPDLGRMSPGIGRKARLLWLCQPHAPTGRCATLDELSRLYAWAAERGIIVASDEAYTDFYYDREPPPSMLEVSRDGVIAFFSLSKRSAMTGYRVGFAAGDRRLVQLLRTLKTNMDSGTPWIVEEAATAALGDEQHVEQMRAVYGRNRTVLCDALQAAGMARCAPEGAIYVWQRLPSGVKSVDFALRLLEPPLALVVTPGPWIAEALEDGTNPGEGYVRFALVPPEASVRRAAERIARLSF